MIDETLTWLTASAQTGPRLRELVHEIVPANVATPPNCPYPKSYGWLFLYEQRVKAAIRQAWGVKRISQLALVGEDGILSEALSNAFVHGHQRNPRRSIYVTGVVGAAGLAFAVADQGTGFDVQHSLKLAAERREYYRQAGNGLRAFIQHPTARCFWEDAGRRFVFFLPRPGERSAPERNPIATA